MSEVGEVMAAVATAVASVMGATAVVVVLQ